MNNNLTLTLTTDPNQVNNNFATYSARATAEKLTIDRNEIGDARWFDIAELQPEP